MPYEGRGGWFWDDVAIKEPCISWEECFECLYQEVFIWKKGKQLGKVNICPDCSAYMYTTFVIVCIN